MTQQDIIRELHELLDMHLKGTRGYIGQEPYKGDFFKLFQEAYRSGFIEPSSSPRLTGDALRETLGTRWFDDDESLNKKRTELLDLLFTKWDEWRYAWDHHD